jgi:hypothetical protein
VREGDGVQVAGMRGRTCLGQAPGAAGRVSCVGLAKQRGEVSDVQVAAMGRVPPSMAACCLAHCQCEWARQGDSLSRWAATHQW